jgi:hypothetical protein
MIFPFFGDVCNYTLLLFCTHNPIQNATTFCPLEFNRAGSKKAVQEETLVLNDMKMCLVTNRQAEQA